VAAVNNQMVMRAAEWSAQMKKLNANLQKELEWLAVKEEGGEGRAVTWQNKLEEI
jgi:hypothetical protein